VTVLTDAVVDRLVIARGRMTDVRNRVGRSRSGGTESRKGGDSPFGCHQAITCSPRSAQEEGVTGAVAAGARPMPPR
jgi:hypothetical protein